MVICILDEQSDVVVIIPAYFSDADALKAAQDVISEAAAKGKTYIAVDEDGENVLPPSFAVPVKNPDVKFEGMVTDRHGEELAEFSGVHVF